MTVYDLLNFRIQKKKKKKRKTNAQVRIKMEVPLLKPKTKERLLIWYFKNPILIADNSSKHWF